MAIHSSTLAWKIPWMEQPGGLQPMGSQRIRQDWVTSLLLCIILAGWSYQNWLIIPTKTPVPPYQKMICITYHSQLALCIFSSSSLDSTNYIWCRPNLLCKKPHLRDLSSQSYDFSGSHVWVWELDYKESWVPKNWYFCTGFGEDSRESLGLPGDQTSPS